MAHAQTVQPQTLPADHKPLQWNDKGRWSLKLDMNEVAGHAMGLRDVQAGAYYHLTPSLRVGGAFTFSDEQPNLVDQTSRPQAQAPRVKLETSFKF